MKTLGLEFHPKKQQSKTQPQTPNTMNESPQHTTRDTLITVTLMHTF